MEKEKEKGIEFIYIVNWLDLLLPECLLGVTSSSRYSVHVTVKVLE